MGRIKVTEGFQACASLIYSVQNSIFGQQVHWRDNITWFKKNVGVNINNLIKTDIFNIEFKINI